MMVQTAGSHLTATQSEVAATGGDLDMDSAGDLAAGSAFRMAASRCVPPNALPAVVCQQRCLSTRSLAVAADSGSSFNRDPE